MKLMNLPGRIGTRPAAVSVALFATLLSAGCGEDRGPASQAASPTVGDVEPAPSRDGVGRPPEVRGRPNVIVVMTDDQTAPSVERAMPRTSRLAGTAAVFTSAIVANPVCCPSRAGFLTGQYPHNNGVASNFPGYPRLREKRNVLPAWLQRSGYATAHVGKFLNGYTYYRGKPGGLRPAPGWGEWYATVRPFSYFDYALSVNGRLRAYGDGDRDYLTRVMTRQALDFIERRSRRPGPFFLSVAPWAPHREVAGLFTRIPSCRDAPIPDPRDVDAFATERLPRPPSFAEPDASDKPWFVSRRTLGKRQVAELTRDYRCRLAALGGVDRMMARIFRTLRRSGELRNTAIIFTSDNGELQGEHRLDGKSLPYEEAARVPLLIWLPGSAGVSGEDSPRRATIAAPVANIDLAPTILDLADARPCLRRARCRQLDGRSLLPLLVDGEWPRDRAILVSSREGDHGICGFEAVRTSEWTFAQYRRERSGGGCRPPAFEELYELGSDPYQLDNLLADDGPEPPAAERLRQRLARLLRCRGTDGGPRSCE
jgi:N-acetylglucosamine-6-sulfatase